MTPGELDELESGLEPAEPPCTSEQRAEPMRGTGHARRFRGCTAHLIREAVRIAESAVLPEFVPGTGASP